MAVNDLITLSEAKDYLGVEHALDDSLIGFLVNSATHALEHYAKTAFVRRTITDERQEPIGRLRRYLYTDRYPIQSVTQIAHESAPATLVDLDNVLIHGQLGRLEHIFSWPSIQTYGYGFLVTYEAGRFVDTMAVPGDLKLACCMLVALRYVSRASRQQERLGDWQAMDGKDLPFGIETLVSPYVGVDV